MVNDLEEIRKYKQKMYEEKLQHDDYAKVIRKSSEEPFPASKRALYIEHEIKKLHKEVDNCSSDLPFELGNIFHNIGQDTQDDHITDTENIYLTKRAFNVARKFRTNCKCSNK